METSVSKYLFICRSSSAEWKSQTPSSSLEQKISGFSEMENRHSSTVEQPAEFVKEYQRIRDAHRAEGLGRGGVRLRGGADTKSLLSPFGCKKCVASNPRSPCFAGKMVVDTRYYEILQIKTDADELTIKKVCPMAFSFAGEAMNSC